jgi:hypothetical protein
MILKDMVNEKMKANKEATKGWSINKIIKSLKTDTIENAINICIDRFKEKKYSIGTDCKGNTRIYYHIENNKLLMSLEKDDFNKNSLDRFYYEFVKDEEKLRVLFDITGGLSTLEKFEF